MIILNLFELYAHFPTIRQRTRKWICLSVLFDKTHNVSISLILIWLNLIEDLFIWKNYLGQVWSTMRMQRKYVKCMDTYVLTNLNNDIWIIFEILSSLVILLVTVNSHAFHKACLWIKIRKWISQPLNEKYSLLDKWLC